MIQHINDPGTVHARYPFLAREDSNAQPHLWEHLIEDVLPAVEGTRTLIIMRPELQNPDGTREPVRPEFLTLAACDDATAEKALRALVRETAQRTRKFRMSGGYADTPFERIAIMQVPPRVFLRICIAREVLDLPAGHLTLAVTGTRLDPDKGIGPRETFNGKNGTIHENYPYTFPTDLTPYWNSLYIKAVREARRLFREEADNQQQSKTP
jgi:hypothetical protein